MIVCKEPVIKHVPLRVSKGVTCSQYEGDECEGLGLLKFDLLALKTLTVIDKTLRMIKERHNKDIDIDGLEPNEQKIFDLFNGKIPTMDTKGIFQFEADKISALLKDIRVDRFEDIIVTNALYRPGPLGAGVHKMYSNYKHGRRKVEYLHPKMGEVLKDTWGIMVYQEQIIKIAQELAGFTPGQADTLRKAVGKKIPELLQKQKEMFVNGCVKNGIKESIAKDIFKQIDFFGGYGFNVCLSGDTTVLNKTEGEIYTLEELAKITLPAGSWGEYVGDEPFVLDSYVDGKIVEDEVVSVFETGENEVYEIELDNGMIIKCTLLHKFICSDGEKHTLQEIIDGDLEILYED